MTGYNACVSRALFLNSIKILLSYRSMRTISKVAPSKIIHLDARAAERIRGFVVISILVAVYFDAVDARLLFYQINSMRILSRKGNPLVLLSSFQKIDMKRSLELQIYGCRFTKWRSWPLLLT